MSPCALPSGVARLGGDDFPWSVWDGVAPLPGRAVAIDTETELIVPGRVPRLALLTASDRDVTVVVRAEDVGHFVHAHADKDLVGHNLPYDLAVIEAHDPSAAPILAAALDEGRLWDTALLDGLDRLARRGEEPRPRDLGTVARELAGVNLRKDDPYRRRYAELIGRDLADPAIEPGFFSYAVADAIATIWAFESLIDRVLQLALDVHRVPEELVCRYGPLTHHIQLRGAIALEAIGRRGLAVDREQVRRLCAQLDAAFDGHYRELLPSGLFKTKKDGTQIRTAKGQPSQSGARLVEILAGVAREHAAATGEAVELPRAEKGGVSTRAEDWEHLAESSPFVRSWTGLKGTGKLISYARALDADRIYPRYNPIVVTGRTSCSGPNVQQVPKAAGFREAIVASPGHLLLQLDYAAIELRTLAHICEQRYGRSVLADVIRGGIDPHVFTAGRILGLDMEGMVAMKAADPAAFKRARQQAKVVNFGVPGGLGAKTLAAYARSQYGVAMTEDEARRFKEILITETYPELGQYLDSDDLGLLATNLGRGRDEVVARLAGRGKARWLPFRVREVLMGQAADDELVERVWDGLASLNRNPDFRAAIRRREPDEDLVRRLSLAPVATTSGRIRGGVIFCQGRNTPFQCLAADGAKLALCNLHRAGFRTVGFVHDEFLVELPDRGGYVPLAEVRAVESIAIDSMAEVCPGIPIAVESEVGRRWSKEAELVVEGDRVLPWGEAPPRRWPPERSPPNTCGPPTGDHTGECLEDVLPALRPSAVAESPPPAARDGPRAATGRGTGRGPRRVSQRPTGRGTGRPTAGGTRGPDRTGAGPTTGRVSVALGAASRPVAHGSGPFRNREVAAVRTSGRRFTGGRLRSFIAACWCGPRPGRPASDWHPVSTAEWPRTIALVGRGPR
ncbi:DNA polymerase [Tautonia plasticadhaerens]|uniref:DNA polymerase I n=1 Tax=Tautonia plasticadhaerens TaxID=2527974 RepID=A0A518H1D1_9BACT|nr:DNA polymerase [Tautonia plasticadhaerens]QDV34650.1 DNA polymerase I [Tautonia plasticadhaerens]